MPKVQITVQAADELREIYRYTFHTYGEAQAERYVERIEQALPRLAERPGLGHGIKRLTGYRRFNTGSHAIIYRPDFKGITVVHVFHQRRNIEALLMREEGEE